MDSYTVKVQTFIHITKFLDKVLQRSHDIYSANGSYTRYSRLCFCFEFMFCWILYSKIDANLPLHDRVELLKSKLELGCLCIALTIEKRTLGIIYDFSKRDLLEDDATEAGAKAKKKKQPREVFTERAKKYFEKAEGVGYLEKVDDKYKWTYRGGIVALVYFFIRIYEPQSPPFKQLQPLFGVEGLTSSRRNLEKTDWYKDEMKRQEMTPEELTRERRERNLKLKEPKEWFSELKDFFED